MLRLTSRVLKGLAIVQVPVVLAAIVLYALDPVVANRLGLPVTFMASACVVGISVLTAGLILVISELVLCICRIERNTRQTRDAVLQLQSNWLTALQEQTNALVSQLAPADSTLTFSDTDNSFDRVPG